MRTPLLGDVVAAARALRAVPVQARRSLLDKLLLEAAEAEDLRLATGRTHRAFGDGSLMAAALRHRVVREPGLDDAEYCRCLSTVLLTIAREHER